MECGLTRCGFCMMVYMLLGCVLTTRGEFTADLPPEDQRKSAFACQDSYIHLSCDNKTIQILQASYGRFSLIVCNHEGIHQGWDLQCSAKQSVAIVEEKCQGKHSCTFKANNELFGDPCKETKKYIEVHYFCEKAIEPKTERPDVVTPTSVPTTEEGVPTAGPDDSGTTDAGSRWKQCPSTERESVYWPPSPADTYVEKKCPSSMRGSASWRCGKRGKWVGIPDLSNCVTIWMSHIQDMMMENRSIEVTIEKLNSHLRGAALGPGDLKQASTTILPGLVSQLSSRLGRTADGEPSVTMEERREIVHSFNKEVVKSGSSLLQSSQSEAWNKLNKEERSRSATSLIVSMEIMALEVAATLDDTETVSSTEENIVMEVSVLKGRSPSDNNFQLPVMKYENGPIEGKHNFSLPLDGISGISITDNLTVTYLFYNNLEDLMNPSNSPTQSQRDALQTVNSNIISASISQHTSSTVRGSNMRLQLSRPMNYTLSHKGNVNDKVAKCAYWKYDISSLIGQWSDDGCRVVETNKDWTTCQCDHLTNFAVLMDVPGTELHSYHQMSLQAITYVGCTVSIICLIMCFISFSIFRNLQSDRNTIHKNLVLCLMVAELLFLFGIGQTDNKVGCAVIAAFLHYFFLTSFSWMCLEGIQLYFMLIEVFEAERSRVRWFYLFGYGLPAVIVAISASAGHEGYGTDRHCWLRTDNYFILSFVIPAAVVVLINIVMLSIAVYMMCRHAGVTATAIQKRGKGKLEKIGKDSRNGKQSIASDTSDSKSPVELPTWLKGSAVLVVLLGLTWIFGFMYVSGETVVMAYIFTILNSLQGLFIFIFHCLRDKKVKKEWRRAIYKAKWLPMCCRVNLGGYDADLSSPRSTSSSQNYFLRLWSTRKRKRSTSSNGKNRRSNLDSFLRSDTSSGGTTRTGLNRYSNQSEKLLPNGQNPYTAMPTHQEGAVNGDLSIIDCSVVDSEYVTEYCQQQMQVSNEKRRYSSGSEDDIDGNDNVSRESTNKNRLSFLSTDSASKVNSEFEMEDETEMDDKYAVLSNGDVKTCPKDDDESVKQKCTDDRLLNDIINLYQNVSGGKNGTHVPTERISASQGDKLDCAPEPVAAADNKDFTKSAPNLKHKISCHTHTPFPESDGPSLGSNSIKEPLIGSLPDLSPTGGDNSAQLKPEDAAIKSKQFWC